MSVKPLGTVGKFVADIAYKLGKNNNPLNAVLAIALFKGINRPLFTMMDKKSDPEAKKYAAYREGITEIVAASTYAGTNKLCVKPLTNIMHKAAKGSSKHKIERVLEFICVCVSAVFLIPAVCNIVLNPIMKGVDKLRGKNKMSFGEKQQAIQLDIKENAVKESRPIEFSEFKPTHKGPNSLLTELQSKYTPMVGGNMKVGV